MQPKTRFKNRALVSALLIELASGATAATITADGTLCTLSDAITAANTNNMAGGCVAGSGDDVIELPANSNVTLNAALPDITSNITINGNQSSLSRDNGAAAFPVINIINLANVTLNELTISNGLDDNNYGAGVKVFDAQVVINDSTIEDNTGGGINITRGNNSELNNSTVIGNVSGASGSYYNGGVTINGGNLTITNSTIASNGSTIAVGGGGVYGTSYAGATELNIINTTISSNTATSGGGGIKLIKNALSDLIVNISNTTIVANSSGTNGGGIDNDDATVTVSQTIVSGNSASNDGGSIFTAGGSMTLSDYNLLGLDGDDGLSGVTIGANDIVPTQVNLSDVLNPVLADNGGSTPTHNLVSSGPAVDAIPVLNCANSNDQRGIMRGNDGNGDSTPGCDIGAVEFQTDLIFADGFDNN